MRRTSPEEEDGYRLPDVQPIPPGGVCLTLGQHGSGICSLDVLIPAWNSEDAEEELKAATAAVVSWITDTGSK